LKRQRIPFTGQAAHSAAAHEAAKRRILSGAGFGTGNLSNSNEQWRGLHQFRANKAGIVYSVVEMPRHPGTSAFGSAALARMLREAKESSERFAKEGNVRVSWARLWQIEPVLFNKDW